MDVFVMMAVSLVAMSLIALAFVGAISLDWKSRHHK